MEALPTAAQRFLAKEREVDLVENQRIDKERQEREKRRQENWARNKAEKLRAWKKGILEEELGPWYNRREGCGGIWLLVFLLTPAIGWGMFVLCRAVVAWEAIFLMSFFAYTIMLGLCIPCNICAMVCNRRRVLNAAAKGEQTLEDLQDLEDEDMHCKF
jgi:hypothetical protein